MTQWKLGCWSRKQKQKSQIKSQGFSIYDSVANDPMKTRLLELEAEAEEPTNHKAQNWTSLLLFPTPTT